MEHGQLEPPQSAASEARWRAMLVNPAPFLRRRRFHAAIPSAPRCKMCARPFGGVGGQVMRLIGAGPWPHNPKYCRGCFRLLVANRGGAEIECSLLFADVRGSTPLAEQMRPRDFNRLMGRFYDAATEVLVDHDAYVDRFVGDEVVALFVPAMAGETHARRAIDAARALMRRTGYADAAGPWIPIGAGVNTGTAYVGSVGEGPNTELTALGDVVNTTARLASAAGAGEILVTAAAAAHAALATSGVERRSLELKGKSAPTEVLVLGVDDAADAD
jgi:adenylate cyclase